MKLKSLIVVTLLCLTSSAFAQWFPARTQVTVLPQLISVQVFNPYLSPVICNGQVFGQTLSGSIYSAHFVEQYINVGGFRFAYVQTTAYSPFVNGWTNIHCRYANYW